MLLKHWPHDKIDLDRQHVYVENPEMSVLANAVDLLNVQLLAGVHQPVRLLEIGCGAYSLLRNALRAPSVWEGIDVIEFDRKGNPSVATRRASVEDIPWPDNSFDIVVSNQSIEHWYEYGVDIERGLSEIRRVLRPEGRAHLNFPIHLHGQRIFVAGDFKAIDRAFDSSGLDILRRVAVEKASIPPYRGWRLCGFPDFMVNKLPSHEETSYVVEYVVWKSGKLPEHSSAAIWKKKPKLTKLQRHLHYGLRYFLWKVTSAMLGRGRAVDD